MAKAVVLNPIETNKNFDIQIKEQLLNLGIPKHIIIFVIAQARLESANYTSSVFKKCNNAFGYKWVEQKKWAIGPCTPSSEFKADKTYYAKYKTVGDSAGEIGAWLKRRVTQNMIDFNYIINAMTFAEALKSCDYFGITAKEYGTELQKILTSNNAFASIING